VNGARAVRIVDTGVANTASVVAALARAGAHATPTLDRGAIAAAPLVVLPGVGSFGAGMDRLGRAGLVGPLTDRIARGAPTLAICLGMQLLLEGSEESPGVAGLGVVPGVARRFGQGVVVPQFGWNAVRAGAGCESMRSGHAYFANSYRLTDPPAGWACATADHGGPFVAGMERGAVVACQFHPELSGAWGLELLRSWVGRGEGAAC